ncbi:hypothetical protein EYV94_27495 [Puteibacter caeruleilacunae]|nr:hypothetical protein EYV94_27495 [Puteibacter caeruleilacunae]
MKQNLSTHIANITYSLISQITEKGVILTQYNSHIEEDIVSTHHTIELIGKLNINLFLHYAERIIHYMSKPENQVVSSLFSVDTMSQLLPENKNVELLVDEVLESQLQSGAFTKYTALLRGGDFFSTLWCLKILTNTEKKNYQEPIRKGFEYLSKNVLDSGISINQKGFFYLLANKCGYSDYDKQSLGNQLKTYILNSEITAESLLCHLYIYEDLLFEADKDTFELIKVKFISVFELNEKAEAIPEVFEGFQKKMAESVYYQCLARFCVVGLEFLENDEIIQLAFETNKIVQSNGQQALYRANTREKQLKEFLSIYGGIHQEFSKYNDTLETIWKEQHGFEKSIFIMMPFKNEIGYNETARIIKKTCEERGFKAIRIDDNDRQFHHTLWDNLVINLLSCKYAIAIYASDQIVDILDSNSPKMFPNPNVALEFGFFTSRGQQTLLLRDKSSPIPSDLQGFIWSQFNIKNPGDDVKNAVNEFLDRI